MSILQHLLRPDNRLTTCPPGKLTLGNAPLVLVASTRRSGTHLLIDAILNNFAVYKRRPLIVDLDQYLLRGYRVEELVRCGSYIVKTHFPQALTAEYEPQIRALVEHVAVLTPVRPLEQMFRSELAFTRDTDERIFAQQYIRFQHFWKQYPSLNIPFARLASSVDYESLLATIGEHIGIAPNKNPVFPIPKEQRKLIYLTKFLTRTLGNYSPRLNTTIAFAKASIEVDVETITAMRDTIARETGSDSQNLESGLSEVTPHTQVEWTKQTSGHKQPTTVGLLR